LDLVEIISRNIFLPISDRLRGVYAGKITCYVKNSQYLSEDIIREHQWQKTKELLDFVYEHNNFYRRRFQSIGATPEDFKSLSDFSRFPILTKSEIRANRDNMVSDQFDKSNLLRRRTGGSTGIPIHVYQDKQCQTLKEALVRRHNSWAQFIPGKKVASLWGDIKRPKLKVRLYNALIGRTIYLDTLKMDLYNTTEFASKIRNSKTRLLFGHGHSIFFFCQFLKEHNIPRLEFDGIISTAEVLTPGERQVVEDMFGKIVFDRYGCEEIGLIASECEKHDGMHVAAEGVLVEISDGNATDPGKVIVTDLLNTGMPLIRYEIGDLATTKSSNCDCGRNLPRIGKITGRMSDFLYTPEGKMISGISILDTLIIHIPGFKQVQIVQEKLNELTFNIVKDVNFSEESVKILTDSIPRYFGPSMNYKIIYLENIPLTGRGKYQCTICKLDNKQQYNK
jgi:phenylacetate-CoA ligase